MTRSRVEMEVISVGTRYVLVKNPGGFFCRRLLWRGGAPLPVKGELVALEGLDYGICYATRRRK
jgi:hypothetical protein